MFADCSRKEENIVRDVTYDANGRVKPESLLTDSEIRKSMYINDKEIIDNRTDFGKGFCYKSVDGKEWSTYEDAMEYNKQWYDQMFTKIDTQNPKGFKR